MIESEREPMSEELRPPQEAKISRTFGARLARLAPEEQIRAIVMVHTGKADAAIPTRGASRRREMHVRATRQLAEAAFPEIDRVLGQFGGKRLSGNADALGAVAVETTAAGILGLTSLGLVKAVLEDQQVYAIS
jgi:hypothetical protein